MLGNAFDLTSIGAQELKGVAAPVEAFVVKGELSVESRFAAHQSGTLTPIVGRDREIELMLERWALARSGHGQVVLVSGEAGIGKSRITRAVIDVVAQDDHTRITYQCSPYHTDSALYPVIQQLSFAAGFAPADNSDARLDKLEALLGAGNDTLKLVAPMMGFGTERYGELDVTPAQQRAQTMQALTRLLVQQARKQPVLLVYEDLHWIDPTSLELFDLLLDAIADQQIMILATARPSFDYGFGGHPIVTRFALNRLGKDMIGEMFRPQRRLCWPPPKSRGSREVNYGNCALPLTLRAYGTNRAAQTKPQRCYIQFMTASQTATAATIGAPPESCLPF